MCAIFAGYLDPKNLAEVFTGCTFASLVGDVTRAGPEVKAAYDDALRRTCVEMARGQGHEGTAYLSAFVLATSAVRSATAAADPDLQSDILRAAQDAFLKLLPRPKEKVV